MIKSGDYIKQIKNESGAYVQISQKSKETNLPERCITITGEMEANKKVADTSGEVVEDPQSGSCPYVSRADFTGPVAVANPTDSRFANTVLPQTRSPETMTNSSYAGNGSGWNLGVSGNIFNMTGPEGCMGFGLSIAALTSPGHMSEATLETLKTSLRNSGFAEGNTEEIASAMDTLASYGVLGTCLGLDETNTDMGMSTPTGAMGGVGSAVMHFMQGIRGMTVASASTPTSSVSSGFLNTNSNSTSAGP